MEPRNPERWKENSVNKARRSRKTKRLLDFCYRATSRGEAPVFSSEESFTRFCAANKGQQVGGVVNDDCQGCKVRGIPGNIVISRGDA